MNDEIVDQILGRAKARLREGTEVLRTGGGATLSASECNAVLEQLAATNDAANELRAEVSKLELGPTDFALVRVQHLTPDMRDYLVQALEGIFPKGRVVVMHSLIEISSLPTAELEAALEAARAAER